VACSRSAATPEAVLRQYLDAITAGDVERAARFVTKADAGAAGKRNLRASEANAVLFARDARFEIGTVAMDGDTATVTATLKMPQIDPTESIPLAQAVADKNTAERDRIIDAARKRPFATSIETYKLVREGDRWRVSPGWTANDTSARDAAALHRKSEADAVRYAQQIPVELRTVEKRSFKFVEGTITNRTGATIIRLDVVFEYRDAHGAIVFTETNHPVLTQRVSDPALREYARKIAPPIGPGESRRVSYAAADDVPPSWSGNVTGRVIEVEFEGEP
jgi:hypothetical protein